jgi:hypothetical protein
MTADSQSNSAAPIYEATTDGAFAPLILEV